MPLDDGQSAYSYENPENGEVSSISFEGDDNESVATPTIDHDRRPQYHLLRNQHEQCHRHRGWRGVWRQLHLIQDKNTGDLYPLVERRSIYKKVEAEHGHFGRNTRAQRRQHTYLPKAQWWTQPAQSGACWWYVAGSQNSLKWIASGL